jgi:hypothetical protein
MSWPIWKKAMVGKTGLAPKRQRAGAVQNAGAMAPSAYQRNQYHLKVFQFTPGGRIG